MAIAVSVIIPTYNRADLLPRALISALSQTIAEIEIIIVDDGSTDNTKDVVERFAREDARVFYVVNRNKKGPAGARNCGLALARGEYVAFLDSDDEWYETHLETALSYLVENPDIDWVFTDSERVVDGDTVASRSMACDLWRNGGKLKDHITFERGIYLFSGVNMIPLLLEVDVHAGLQVSVVRREVFDKIRFCENLRIGEDRLLTLEAILSGFTLAHVPNVTVRYHVHGDHLSAVSGGSVNEVVWKALEVLKYYNEVISKIMLNRRGLSIVNEKRANVMVWWIGRPLVEESPERISRLRGLLYIMAGLRLRPTDPSYWRCLCASIIRCLRWYGGNGEPR